MSVKREIPFGRPWITDEDRNAVMEVLNGHILTHGPKGVEFETAFVDFMGAGHATSTSSCMASLHLAAINAGYGPGDEVILPAQTHVATAHAVELTGAKPVFVDCELTTGNIDIGKIEAAITPRTRGITVVHFNGIPVAMPDVLAIAKKHKLKVTEDCALALGTRYDGRHAGLFGDSGCYSFYPVKHITTGEGGMFVSQHQDVVKKVANFRAFSVDRTHGERAIPGIYDVSGVGMNYRMSEMQAALGVTQMKKVPEILRKRQENFRALKSRLAASGHVRVLDASDNRASSSYYCLTALLQGPLAKKREAVVNALKARGIGTSVYYPHPVPRLKYYREKYGYDPKRFPCAAAVSDESVALPVGPHLGVGDMNAIADAFADVAKGIMA